MRRFGAAFAACVGVCIGLCFSIDAVRAGELNPEIIGGKTAKAGQWPFQVALLDAAIANNYMAQICGGSLVDKYHVVTAAHCVYETKASKLRVLTGTQSLDNGGTRHQIATITVHPQYSTKTFDYDIAVIRLKTAASVSRYAKPITSSQESKYAKAGTKAVVIGWGSTVSPGHGYPEKLQQVTVPLVSRKNCNDSNSYNGLITSHMICAGLTDGGKDACDGDSGGPLLVKDAHHKYTLLAGITSWGDSCAQKNYYGVYSRVAVLSSWAKGVINADTKPKALPSLVEVKLAE